MAQDDRTVEGSNFLEGKLLIALPGTAPAQTADELAKQTQNPVASLISVPLQGNWDFGLGDRDGTATLLNVQPVIPFGISKSWCGATKGSAYAVTIQSS